MEVDLLRHDVRMIEQRAEERGHAAEERRLVARDRFDHVADVARVRDQRQRHRRDDGQRLRAGAAVGVKQRQRQHDAAVLAGDRFLQPRRELHARGDERAMIADHAFGCAGGAAGHEDHRRIVRLRAAQDVAVPVGAFPDEFVEPEVVMVQFDAMPFLLLFGHGEEEAQHAG